MHTRRQVLSGIAGVGMVGLAGCSLLAGPIERSAEPAGVADETRDSNGFEHQRTEPFTLEQTVSVAGESRDLRLTNYVVEYGKPVGDLGPQGSRFVLFTTPSVTVAGEEANPFAEFDDRRLLGDIVGRSEQSASDVQEAGTRTTTVLEDSVEFRVYEASTTVEGQEIPIRLHFGRTSDGSDLLGLLGVHPEILDEEDSIYELAGGTVHPFEFDTETP